MAASIAHRGPDGHGFAADSGRAFGHVRLAIVDAAGGAQPIFNEQGDIGIVFNGEIYNYASLRQLLLARGHVFRTLTDTEVIVHLFEEYGPEAFSQLIGMFSFALWTPDCTYLVRDQVGIKPLYYYTDQSQVLFASELRAILAVPSLDLALDEVALKEYLTFRYCPSERTVFKNVRRLSPAHYIEIRGARVQPPRRYYDLSQHIRYLPARQREEALIDTLREVVSSQLMGEVPIGLTLSGGLDSSCIACVLGQLGASVETFNIGFRTVNEFEYSESIAREMHLSQTAVLLDQADLASYLSRYLDAIDEPIADAACLPLYRLCETMSDRVTVVLSGEGADELFGGYPQYVSTLEQYSEPSQEAFQHFLERSWYFARPGALRGLGQAAPAPQAARFSGDLLSAMLSYDMHTWVPENLMMKADKILMAHGLEGRFPFLDLRMLELAAGLPAGDKIGFDSETKVLLRKAFRRWLPSTVATRAKMGFSVPIGEILERNRSVVEETLSAASPLDNALDRAAVRAIVSDHYSARRREPLLMWTLFVLYAWFERARASPCARASVAA